MGLRLSAASQASRGAPSDAPQNGVRVVGIEPTGSAAAHGLQVGDVIVQVDGQAVNTPAEVQNALDTARNADKRFSLLQLRSGEGARFVAVPPDPA